MHLFLCLQIANTVIISYTVFMKKLLAATSNEGKVKEIKKVLGDLSFEILSLKDAGIDLEVEETGKTFKENAILKAKEYALESGLLTLADDSGLEIDALGGKPGVYSARFLPEKSWPKKNQAVLEMMKRVLEEKRGARFVCVVAIASPDGVKTTEGVMEGKISYGLKGKNGFGYDPIFIPKGFKKTNAELTADEKNEISHRGKALRKAFEILKEL